MHKGISLSFVSVSVVSDSSKLQTIGSRLMANILTIVDTIHLTLIEMRAHLQSK